VLDVDAQPPRVRTRGANPAAVVATGGMARSTIGPSAAATPNTSRTVVNAESKP
jgi:hypothetical protein